MKGKSAELILGFIHVIKQKSVQTLKQEKSITVGYRKANSGVCE